MKLQNTIMRRNTAAFGTYREAALIKSAPFKTLMLSVGLILAGSVTAGPLSVDKNSANRKATNAQNFAALRATAVSAGKVRIDLLYQLPPGTELVSNASEISARSAAVLAEVASFQNQYASSIVGSLVHANLTPMIQVDLTASGLDQLLADADVRWFSKQGIYEPFLREVNSGLQISQLPTMGNASNDSSAIIAVIDSGVDIAQAEFSGRFAAGACFSTSTGDFVNTNNPLPSLCVTGTNGPAIRGNACNSANPDLAAALQNCGHGTHVAGIATGKIADTAANGIAPAARILAIQTKSLATSGDPQSPYTSTYNSIDVVNSLNYVLANRLLNGRKVAAVNMSFGYFATDAFWNLDQCANFDFGMMDAMNDLTTNGVAVVAAAGNVSTNYYGMAFPACAQNVVSVGATSKAFLPVGYSAYGFSSAYGFNGAEKLPTLLAPGGDNVSQGFATPPISCTNSTSNTGPVCAAKRSGVREQRSGTSMSAPIVASLIARLTDRFPALTGVQAAELLRQTGAPVVVNAALPAGIPRVTPVAAFRLASLPRSIAGTASSTACTAANLSWQAPVAQPVRAITYASLPAHQRHQAMGNR